MSKVKWTLLTEARKLRAKAFRKRVEADRFDKEALELEDKANRED